MNLSVQRLLAPKVGKILRTSSKTRTWRYGFILSVVFFFTVWKWIINCVLIALLLKDETKKAAKEEEERKKRIADRQKQYNDVFVGDLALSNAQIDHLVLDFDPKTKEELVSVDQHLVKKLKPHQVKGNWIKL